MAEALSAQIEMELGPLEPAEARIFMVELGIPESGLDRVIRLSYRLLGLISFLTAGPDEVRAWPIPDGSTAVEAAAAIHTDLAKGFIRAETVAYEDLVALGSMEIRRSFMEVRLSTSTRNSATSANLRRIPSTVAGNTLLPRTITMSSSRPRIPPSSHANQRPHAQRSRIIRT